MFSFTFPIVPFELSRWLDVYNSVCVRECVYVAWWPGPLAVIIIVIINVISRESKLFELFVSNIERMTHWPNVLSAANIETTTAGDIFVWPLFQVNNMSTGWEKQHVPFSGRVKYVSVWNVALSLSHFSISVWIGNYLNLL